MWWVLWSSRQQGRGRIISEAMHEPFCTGCRVSPIPFGHSMRGYLDCTTYPSCMKISQHYVGLHLLLSVSSWEITKLVKFGLNTRVNTVHVMLFWIVLDNMNGPRLYHYYQDSSLNYEQSRTGVIIDYWVAWAIFKVNSLERVLGGVCAPWSTLTFVFPA